MAIFGVRLNRRLLKISIAGTHNEQIATVVARDFHHIGEEPNIRIRRDCGAQHKLAAHLYSVKI
jgi:hypothetical protein